MAQAVAGLAPCSSVQALQYTGRVMGGAILCRGESLGRNTKREPLLSRHRRETEYRQWNRLLHHFLDWVTEQFRGMGRDDAADLGAEFVAALHGIVLVANALNDRALITGQVARLHAWIDGLEPVQRPTSAAPV